MKSSNDVCLWCAHVHVPKLQILLNQNAMTIDEATVTPFIPDEGTLEFADSAQLTTPAAEWRF